MTGAFAAVLLLVESGSVPGRLAVDFTLGRSDPLVGPEHAFLGISGRAIPGPGALAAAPVPFARMTPEEVVLAIANRLNLGDSSVAVAAAWLAGSRVQLDVTPHRFFVKVRVPSS